ncbi:eIF-2alpha kinase GCN2 similar to Eukaryotic translation initiation factor 2-alpha kinase 4 (GCN2-li [Ectocarpus siliculosus]|uniref:non-specific serine/threonine protein kinase n=1 Tax=Ectocarpus siliculosus TaxID=2880 RepID=D7G2X9_ECTSI|nr:eIF-2alpha kinase GCN2 similar to Eukaryotic translation initiation factor 2-alpha kinase 4 (GCN2-li [Ectocarpus siliculosus]|eukprot:CBJ48836.1 eIF-2alpha kinase GCN2 similar to Eukaryotic translation initiation factor 2-alpha kinase 4 (GCN2-li [Ectocarpus siliculosus]
MDESEAAQEIEALRAIWPELQDRPPVWNCPAIAIPVCPLGSLDAKRPTRITVVVIFNPRYPKVPPRLELESPSQLDEDEVARLKHMLDVKAAEVAGTGMVMVHDLLVLTNDFLSDKNRADEERSRGGDESLFQKMLTEEQRQRDKREEEERAEEKRQRDEEAKELLEEEAKGEAQWAVVREKLEQERERAASAGFLGAMEGVIPEVSAGGEHEHDTGGEGAQDQEAGAAGERGGLGREEDDEDSNASDDSWMNHPQDNHNGADRRFPAGGGGGEGGSGAVKERSSWYRSQFKELENLGKGGFGTVVKVRNRVDRRLYAVKKVGLDPFDKETNRKIRREVTTISTLIHKNIVRYYQAWLEGGGGAFPAAVEEEHSGDEDDDDDDEDDHLPRDTGTMSTGLEDNEADGSHVHFDDGVGGRGCRARHSMQLGEGDAGSTVAVGGEDSSAAPGTTAVLGKKAKRLLRKQARKKKRLLVVAAATAAAVGSGDAGVAGKGWEGTTDQEGSNDQGNTGSEEGSWGSGGGDYRSHGQGKLVSDAEFFQYFGSPERARQVSDAGAPPVPASWSSEDALMQLYEETRRNRDRGNKPSAASAASSSAKTPNRSLPSSLPGSPRPGGTGGLDSLIAPPPPVTRGGERQFLYIQMEYCENTLRHLIDHGELWREEQRCWRLFRQMLEGVDFIHSKGIIHRDLTPPNVFLDGEENVKLGDFGLATSKKPRTKGGGVNKLDRGAPYDDDDDDSTNADGGLTTSNGNYDGGGSMSSAFPSVFGELELPLSDTSQLTDGVGTGPYIAPEQGARFGQYNHKADMWSLGVILFEMLAPRFSTLMERAGVMTALRSPGGVEFPPAFEERVPDNAKQVIRWLLMTDADARPTAAELLSSALLPPKLEVEASFLREALRVMGNPESDTFQVIVKALLDQETAEHVEHWYDHEPLKTVSARIPIEAPAVALVCDGLRRVFETHGATPVAPPTIRPKPPPSLAPPALASRGLVRLVDRKGAVVTLPGNLTVPFARFVARSGVTRLKRYQIDRIFLAGGAGESDDPSSDRSCVEAWEADFDIISSGHSSSAAAASYGGAGRGVDGNSGITARLPTSLGGDGRGVRAALGHHDSGEGRFEVAEAEAVLVISQVMGTFEGFLGPWFLRLGHVKMSQAILELCGVPQDVRPIVTGLLGKLARGSITPAKAFSEVGSKGLSEETLLNVRPFLHHMGKEPFEALSRLEVLVQRIPAVKSVMELPGRRSEHAASRDRNRTDSADSRAGGDRSDGDPRGGSIGRRSRRRGGGGDSSTAAGFGLGGAVRTGGELDGECWKGGVVVMPSFVMLDLGLTQRQGSYASGTVFQAALVNGASLSGRGDEGYRTSLTVAEGGRYDDLVAKHRYHLRATSKVSGSSALCAVGVRFAVEKLASMLVTPRNESLPGLKNQPQISRRPVDAIVCAGGGFESQGLQERVLVAARLWAGGIRAEYLATDALVRAGAGKGGGLEGAAEACLSLGIPFVVVVRPHTLVAKKAVKVMSVMEKGGGQLEVPLDHLAQHVMTRQEYKNYSTLERKAASLLDAAIAGPIEGKREGNGPLVLATEASFAAVRGLTTCYMLYGAESKSLQEFLADHPEKKVLRNLLTSLQQVEEGGRRKGGGGRGQQQGKGGRDQQAQSSSHARQVFVYSQPDEVMDIMTFSNPSASGGLLGHHQSSASSSARAGRGLR